MNQSIEAPDSRPVILPRHVFSGRFAASRYVPFHSHEGHELVLVTKGKCTCTTGSGSPLSGSKGTLFVVPENMSHDQCNTGFTKTTYVVFTSPPGQFDTTARTIEIPDRDPVLMWMECLCDYAMMDDREDSLVAGAILLACLGRLSTLEHRKLRHDALHPALARAIKHLDANLNHPYLAAELAHRTGLSVSYMNALFKQHLHCTPLHYLHNQRLRRAQRLLLDPYARVNETAMACGYEDTNYFVRLFTRKFEVSPGAWRRNQTKTRRPTRRVKDSQIND